MSGTDLTVDEYRALAEFRYQIRRFVQFSAEVARANGLEPQQHQLLLAVKGLPEGARPTIRELAERLQIQHHSAVELVDRMEKRGLFRRERSKRDRRHVIVHVTAHGEALLSRLVRHRINELRVFAPALTKALHSVLSAASQN